MKLIANVTKTLYLYKKYSTYSFIKETKPPLIAHKLSTYRHSFQSFIAYPFQ